MTEAIGFSGWCHLFVVSEVGTSSDTRRLFLSVVSEVFLLLVMKLFYKDLSSRFHVIFITKLPILMAYALKRVNKTPPRHNR